MPGREAGMAGTGNVDVVRAAVAALNDGDTAGYISYFEPSCKRWVAGIVDPLELDVITENLISLAAAFDPLKLVEEALFGDGDLVCARWRLVGTHVADYLGIAATGREVAVESAEVYEVRGGRVTAVWTYQDPLELFRQIGAA